MRIVRNVVAVSLAFVCSMATASSAFSEGFADLFLGASLTDSGKIKLDGTTFNDQDYQTSVLAGARVGYWWGFFGVNLDFSYFAPQLDPSGITTASFIPGVGLVTVSIDTDQQVFTLGANAMLRGQFGKDATVPEGRFQPYIFAGPTLFFSRFDLEGSASALGTTLTFDESDSTTTVGVTAGGGFTYMFTKNIGAFAEYRFTHFRPEYEISVSGTRINIEPTLNTHHLGAGVSLRF